MMNSSKRKKSKKAAAGAVLLAVMLATAACSGANANKPAAGNDQQGNVEESPVITDLPEETGVIDPDVSAPEPTAEPEATVDNGTATAEPAEAVKVNEGIYSGLSDSHSIEIETAAGAIPLQITDEMKSDLEALPDDAKVKFEYTEKAIEGDASAKQYWLVSIAQMKE
ncbi:hypothetical protein [Paenibacillus sinopodophylli]|uniref:hypothetical protein n=1 Tax=Paenibacillus sinopodophylli TaxID=1837342 RepID=UPI00110C992F|nr:hypothetical protein [Paenibacillus sinopodophylli]